MQQDKKSRNNYNKNKNQSNDLTQGSVFCHLVRLTLPFTIALFATMSVGLVDSIYLGRLHANALAAIGFLMPVMFAINSISIGLGAGAASVISRSIGEKNIEKQKRRSTSAFLLSFLVMGLISILLLFNVRTIFIHFGISESVMSYINDYMYFWRFSPLVLSIPMMTNSILRSMGSTFWASIMMILSAIMNAVLDPFLIFGLAGFPELGMKGASLATLIGQFVSVCVAIILIYRSKLICLKTLKLESIFRSWKEISYVGVPAALTNAIGPVSVALATAGISYQLGEFGVAGFGAGVRTEMFTLAPLFALSATIGAVVGQNKGANLPHRVKQSFISAYLISFIWGIGIGLIFMIFQQFFASLFSKETEIISITAQYFLIVPISMVGYGILISASSGFNALGKPVMGLLLTIGRSFLLYVPGVWFGAVIAGAKGAFIGIMLANIISGLVCTYWTVFRSPLAVEGKKKYSKRKFFTFRT